MPDPSPSAASLDELRRRVRRLEGALAPGRDVLPFGVEEIDGRLPGGGLVLGALHEVAPGGVRLADRSAATLFCAGIAARTKGSVLWCVARQDLFAPGLHQAGLSHGRVLFVEAGEDRGVLACFEEGLRHGGLGAVVAEVARLSMTASRRLQLAAERSGVLALALRSSPEEDAGLPTASLTRWRVVSDASVPLVVPGLGAGRWRLELVRCRGAEPAAFEVEAVDGSGRLSLSAPLADRSAAPQVARQRA
jgi:protein ImuA